MEVPTSDSPAQATSGRRGDAAVTFGILGSMEISVGERAVRLNGSKRRALLAVLLLNNGRVMSVDRLIDALWGEQPPTTARAQIQALVSAVRRTLNAVGVAIETCRPGYVIKVPPDHLDLAVFEHRVGQAQKACTDGDIEGAVSAFRAALGLWRGPVLDGVEAPFAEVERARLGELRLSVVEECMAAELELGRHGAVTTELVALVAEYPLRERLRGQFMLALYRCGRQAEALEAYQEGRTILAEELGLDPGPDLRALQQSMLNADPGLDLPPDPRSRRPPAPSVTAEDRPGLRRRPAAPKRPKVMAAVIAATVVTVTAATVGTA